MLVCVYNMSYIVPPILIKLQIRAEEISQTQYMIKMKFSAQGLDKKVCMALVTIQEYIQ